MPIVLTTAVPRVFPSAQELAIPGFEPTPEMQSFGRFLQHVRGIVCDALNEVGEATVSIHEVILIPQRFHPWAENNAEVWIDLQPGDVGGPPGQITCRRAAIRDLVRAAVDLYFSKHPADYRPSIDIECRPLASSGVRIDQQGHGVAKWDAG